MTSLTPQTIRRDLKCGNGAISENETCHVGKATAAKGKPKAQNRIQKGATFKEKALIYGGLAGIAAGTASGVYNTVRAIGTDFSKKQRSKDPYINLLQKHKESLKFRARAQASGLVAGAGIALLGGGVSSMGKRTKGKDLQRFGRNLGYSGALFAGSAGLNFAETIDNRKRLVEEAKKYRRKMGQARYVRRETKKTYENFENFAEEFKRRYQQYAGSSGGGRARRSSYSGDPYNKLGLGEKATEAELKAAWKRKMRENHPDLGGDANKAKEINEAYQEILRRRGIRDSVYADGFDIDWSAITI